MAREESPDGKTSGARADTPGYRRRIRVIPRTGRVLALLEDDIHAMAVRLHHDGERVLAVEPVLDRMPWTTCPGAAAVLVATFEGALLTEVTLRKARKANCTHLHDLAVIAAAHAGDTSETCFDIAVSDPQDGRRDLLLWRNGSALLHWIEQDGVLIEPAAVAGRTLMTLRDVIAAMPGGQGEAARLLQWGSIVAHGRTIPMARQSDAALVPPNCYTFQPERAAVARRVGKVVDFGATGQRPGERLERQLALEPY